MGADRVLEVAPRGDAAGLILGGEQRAIGFQRELGVDHDRARRVRQPQQAVGATPVAERRLEEIGGLRQRALHQILELQLAEGAARLLVGKNVLQPHHLAREVGEVLLRRIDHGEPLGQRRERLPRLLGRLLELLPDLLAEIGETLLDRLGERPLLGLQPVREQGLARGLGFRHLGEPSDKLGRGPLAAAPGAPGGRQRRRHEQQQDGAQTQQKRRIGHANRPSKVKASTGPAPQRNPGPGAVRPAAEPPCDGLTGSVAGHT